MFVCVTEAAVAHRAHAIQLQNMSRDDMRDVGHDGPEKECKAFVGGISWHMSDRELKDSECCGR